MSITSTLRGALARMASKAATVLTTDTARDQGLVAMVRSASRPATIQTLPEAYKLNPWVFTATSAIAENAASVPLRLMRARGDDDPEEITSGSPLNEIAYPNPTCTGFQLWEATVSWLVLSGNAFWFVVTNRFGFPREIYYLDPRRIEIKLTKGGELQYLLDTGVGGRRELPSEQLIHFKTFNPFNAFYGLSPLAVLRMAIEADIAADSLTSTTSSTRPSLTVCSPPTRSG